MGKGKRGRSAATTEGRSSSDDSPAAKGQCKPISRIRLVQDGDGDLHVEGLSQKVLKGITDDDPLLFVEWDASNLDATVAAINAAPVAPPAWIGLAPLTAMQLQTAILHRVCTAGGGGGVIGCSVIAPNTMTQYSKVQMHMGYLGLDPFLQAHAVCPVGRCFIVADRQSATRAVADPVHPPPAPGVPVIA